MGEKKDFGARQVGSNVVVSGKVSEYGGFSGCDSWILVPSSYLNKSGIYSGKGGEKYQVVVGSETVVAIDLVTGQPYTVECRTGHLLEIDSGSVTDFQLILESDNAKDS